MTETRRRDWLLVGAKLADGRRNEICQTIHRLKWRSPAGELPAMPGLAIRACVEQLNMPAPEAVAIGGCLDVRDGEDGWAHYEVLGIEASYTNGLVRAYVVDKGSEIVPVCVDFYPATEEAE